MWLNSIKYTGTELPTNVDLHPPFIAGQILLHVPEKGTSYPLRPGQTLDINDGRIRESYERAPVASEAESKPVPEPAAPLTEPPSGPVQVPGIPPPSKP